MTESDRYVLGVGISALHRPSVFERFVRGDNSDSRTAEGSGIGLSLVKELVRLHGGNVGVTSEVGVGSTFTIWIPRGSSHLPQDRIFETTDPGASEAAAFKNLTSLNDGTPQASAMERWNAKTRGIDRTSILEVCFLLLQFSSQFASR